MMICYLLVTVEHSTTLSIVETVVENESILRLHCKFERADGYLFQMLKLVQGPKSGVVMCACMLCR